MDKTAKQRLASYRALRPVSYTHLTQPTTNEV